MTTVAFDGRMMAADTLATDYWGLKEDCRNKILRGPDFLCGSSGEHGAIMRWWATVGTLDLEHVLAYGYPSFNKDWDDPAIMLADASGCIWRHVTGGFFEVSRGFHAVGSGRDYALAAMELGGSAADAVRLAMRFDNGTGGDVVTVGLQYPRPITDTERLDFLAAGAFIVQEIEDGVERWRCQYGIGQFVTGASLREALDEAIRHA